MSDYLAGFYPDFVENEEPRQIILDLGKMITNRIPVKLGFQKLNKYDPEYWGLLMQIPGHQMKTPVVFDNVPRLLNICIPLDHTRVYEPRPAPGIHRQTCSFYCQTCQSRN